MQVSTCTLIYTNLHTVTVGEDVAMQVRGADLHRVLLRAGCCAALQST